MSFFLLPLQPTKDFFGRVKHKTTTATAQEEGKLSDFREIPVLKCKISSFFLPAKTDAIVKSPIWYRYKEGFNNAVRKDVHLNELL